MSNGALRIPPLTVVAITIGLSLLQVRERGTFRTGCAPDDGTRAVLEEALAALDTARLYRPNLPIAGPEHRAFRAADPTYPDTDALIKMTLYRSYYEDLLRHALDPTLEPPKRGPETSYAAEPSPVYARWLEECAP
ncbi:hypothetical protein [Candidatus Palauibacter sp.]|uniref:hypothetical protein n=1 Tax=Candidatus Palauibacter sp. TaxID=3101350 RepID=UPI003B52D045